MLPDDGRDEDVMAEVALGKSQRLEQLVRRHATPLLTFIRRLVGDRHHSEEIFQDVFLAVWTKRQQYEFPRSFKNWLYAIALNKCRESFRARGLPEVPLHEQDTVAFPVEGASPIETVMAAETVETVHQAVLSLPPQQRAVITLRVWENMPYPRIARIVGCSEATARSHMHLGLVTLRKVLRPQVGGTQFTGERS